MEGCGVVRELQDTFTCDSTLIVTFELFYTLPVL